MSLMRPPALALLSIMLVVLATGLAGGARAQPLAARQWQVQVDNLSPEGHNWSFNAFYPSLLQAHAGDTITFNVAPNPNAFHHVTLLPAGFTPQQGYSGFMFPDPYVDGGIQATFFNNTPNFGSPPHAPCGRAEEVACVFEGARPYNTAMLTSPPVESGGRGNPSFTFTLAPAIGAGSYYYLCLVHGPGMSGRIDVLPPAQAAQSEAQLAADARRAYEGDLLQLIAEERAILAPTFEVNQTDGLKRWRVPTGGGQQTRLAVNQFGVRNLFVNPGDTVTWEVDGPPGVFHALSGFATRPGEAVTQFEVITPACEAPADQILIPAVAPVRSTGRELPPFRNGVRTVSTSEDEFTFDPDIWHTCPTEELALVTPASIAAPASGAEYRAGPVTSGILMNQAFLESPAGAGLPFRSSYSLRMMEAGVYHYVCVVHDGMEGWITVRPRPTPPGEPGEP